MRKLIVKEWMTLDGIIDADTMDKWFNPYDSGERQNYIRETVLASDAMLYAKTTCKMLYPYWSKLKNNEMGIAGKLNNAPKYVVSSKLKKPDWHNSTIISKSVVEEISKLKKQPGKQILLDGSAKFAQSLIKTDLIDEYQFLIHPVIMGKGKNFFKKCRDIAKMKLVKIKEFPNGVTLLCYQPEK